MANELQCPNCDRLSFSITKREAVGGIGARAMVVYGVCDNPRCDFYNEEIALPNS